MDWAKAIENEIVAAYSSHGAILAADGDGLIAAALRKAKADERDAVLSFVEWKIDEAAHWDVLETREVLAEIQNGKHRGDGA